MARRRLSQVDMSMFPFLSVLCAVIGILMLFMIVVITTRVVESQELVPPALRATVSAPQQKKQETDEPGIPDEVYESLEREVQALTRRLVQRRDECRELESLCRQLDELVKMKKTEIALGAVDSSEVGRPLGAPEPVAVIPDSAHRVAKKPIPIEVTLEGFTVHPAKDEYPVEQLEQKDSPLRKYIASVDQQREEQYMLLLVHPNGAATYTKLRSYLLEHHNKKEKRDVIPGLVWYEVTRSRIDLGVEPFSRDWLLVAGSEPE